MTMTKCRYCGNPTTGTYPVCDAYACATEDACGSEAEDEGAEEICYGYGACSCQRCERRQEARR